MLLATFRIRFPEFRNAADDLVSGALTGAATQVDADVWGDKYDEGHGLLAAHLLALSPFGQGMRMVVAGAKTTTYWTHYENMLLHLGDSHVLVT